MKTGRTALNLRKTLNFYRTLNICKAFDICKILLTLDGRSGTHGVSKASENKASRPVLDVEEVTVSLSTNVKA